MIVAIRTGKGMVIRTGLPQWEQRMAEPNVSALIAAGVGAVLA